MAIFTLKATAQCTVYTKVEAGNYKDAEKIASQREVIVGEESKEALAWVVNRNAYFDIDDIFES